MKRPTRKKLLTIPEASQRRGVSMQTVRNRIASGAVQATTNEDGYLRLTLVEADKITAERGGRPANINQKAKK